MPECVWEGVRTKRLVVVSGVVGCVANAFGSAFNGLACAFGSAFDGSARVIGRVARAFDGDVDIIRAGVAGVVVVVEWTGSLVVVRVVS